MKNEKTTTYFVKKKIDHEYQTIVYRIIKEGNRLSPAEFVCRPFDNREIAQKIADKLNEVEDSMFSK